MSSRSPKPSPNPLEVWVDAMLGDVAKWLRFFGIKVHYRQWRDEELLSAAFLLTADRELCSRVKTLGRPCALITGSREERLAKALLALHLPPEPQGMFCMLCSSPLLEVPSSRAPVPEGVKAHHSTVFYCPRCGKYYWKGRHWKNMMAFLSRVKELYRSLQQGFKGSFP